MKVVVGVAAVAACFAGTLPAASADCWSITDLKGQSAWALDGAYEFEADAISKSVRLCFVGSSGIVEWNGARNFSEDVVIRLGDSTLTAYYEGPTYDQVDLFQIDRIRGAAHLVRTRARWARRVT